MSQLKNQIIEHRNLFPKDFCEQIVETAESNGHWNQSCLAKNVNGKRTYFYKRDSKERTDSEIWLERTAGLSWVRNTVEDKILPLVKTHPLYKYDVLKLYEFRLLKYEAGGFLKPHTDSSKIVTEKENSFYGVKEELVSGCSKRWLTLCLYLSNHVGGELFFNCFNKKYSTPQGSLLIFPGTLPAFKHESLPVISGTKYVITSWACS